MTRKLEEINTELTGLINANQKEIEKVEKDLLAIEPTITKAKEDIIKAKKKVDAVAYDNAKRELWTAENTKEMLTDKLNELRHAPIVTKEKYRELYYEIVTVGDNKSEEVFEKISSVFPELNKINNEQISVTNKIWDNLHLLEKLGRGEEEYAKNERGAIESNFWGGLKYYAKTNASSLLNSFIERYERIKQ